MTLSLACLLAESALRRPTKTAVIHDATSLSYAELWEQARRYAAVLRERGVGPGDRVGLLMPNLPQFPMTYYGALALGAVVVPIHSLLKAEEIAYVLSRRGGLGVRLRRPVSSARARPVRSRLAVPLLTVLSVLDPAVDRLDLLAADARSRSGPTSGTDRTDRRRGPALHLGHDRQAQGCGACPTSTMVLNAQITARNILQLQDGGRDPRPCCRCSTRSARPA